ncbi:MAG: acyltransferase family protein [Oscillospiraceae bacterium]|nr:acyltransferase family protein [Oscillospiraceae bacterium]
MKRDANLDLIRSVAIVFVLLLHFVMGSGWYGMPDLGFAGWTMELCRALFVSCVPLFLLLSGYLCAEKTLSARYYLGLVRIYVVYLLSCALSLFVRIVVLKEDIGLRQAVGSIFSHQANEYSWYVSMYTGLFLLIPFLNAGYAALKSRRQRRVLVWTLVYLSAVPSLLNMRLHLYEVWWPRLYPLAYYFIGVYLRGYRPRLRTGALAGLLLAALLAAATLDHFASTPGPFNWADYTWYDGFQTMAIAVLVFLLLLSLDLSRCPKGVAGAIGLVAKLSFTVYLFSGVTDLLIYRLGQRLIPPGYGWLWAYLGCALLSFLAALGLAWLAEKLIQPLTARISAALTGLYRRLFPAEHEGA